MTSNGGVQDNGGGFVGSGYNVGDSFSGIQQSRIGRTVATNQGKITACQTERIGSVNTDKIAGSIERLETDNQ